MNIELMMQIVLGLITIIGALMTYIIIPYIKTKTTKEQRDTVVFWVKFAVKAAEQLFPEAKSGEYKKEYVINFLTEKGIKITMADLEVLIEATVEELNSAKEQLK